MLGVNPAGHGVLIGDFDANRVIDLIARQSANSHRASNDQSWVPGHDIHVKVVGVTRSLGEVLEGELLHGEGPVFMNTPEAEH